MRYYEIVDEATDQFWRHAARRFIELQQDLPNDPEGVIAECEALIQLINTITPADPGEDFLIESAVESCDDLIGAANQIINQRP